MTGHRQTEEQCGRRTDLLDVLFDELEDKAAVHEGQQVMQEERQARVQALDQRGLLETQTEAENLFNICFCQLLTCVLNPLVVTILPLIQMTDRVVTG